MLISRDLIIAATVVALAYLGESIYTPVAGSIAQDFGQPEVSGYGFVSAAFYGAALSGLFILLIVGDRRLEQCLVGALVVGAALNLLSLAVPAWGAALGLRFGAGVAFGTAVGGMVILMAQSARDVLLAGRLSVMFSIVFLIITPVMAAVPLLVARIGLMGLGALHAALCLVAAAAVLRTHPGTQRGTSGTLRFRTVRDAFPRVFWSGRKALAFCLHAANLFAAMVIMIGIPPALAAEDIPESAIGLFLAALSAATFVGGFVHSWLSRQFGMSRARWALIMTESVALTVSAALATVGPTNAVYLAALALATKGISGGPPSFEAMLYDLGPTDPAASGLQRSLGMIAAITATSLLLGLATRLQIDILSTILGALAVVYLGQITAFAVLSRAPAGGCGGAILTNDTV